MIQVRLKDAPPSEIVALARALVGALAVPVIVNDRVDIALAAGAAGAHLGQEDLSRPLHGTPPVAHRQERAHESADHRVAERVRGDMRDQQVRFVAAPLEPLQ